MRIRQSLTLTWIALTLVVLGCGSDDAPTEPSPPAMPSSSTPAGAISRLIWAYENLDADTYAKLFTGNFTFLFSNDADPDLVLQYAAGWFRDDEVFASDHLMNGGVDQLGNDLEAASRIELSFSNRNPIGDSSSGRDPTRYATLVTEIELEIDIGDDTFRIGAGSTSAQQRFFLVRGDEARGLVSGQPADSLHWYIHNWRDETPSLSSPRERSRIDGAQQSITGTWGQVKAAYR